MRILLAGFTTVLVVALAALGCSLKPPTRLEGVIARTLLVTMAVCGTTAIWWVSLGGFPR